VTDLRTAAQSTVAFDPVDVLAGMSYSYGFALHDLDGDGRVDLSFFDSFANPRADAMAAPGAIGYVQWNGGPLEQIAAADTYPEIPSAVGSTLFERHVVTDVDGDGRADIVGVVNSHGAVVAYLNPGARGVPWTRRTLSAGAPGAVNIAVGDLDGDGLPDLVVALRHQVSVAAEPDVRGLVWLKNPGDAAGTWVQRHLDNTDDLVDPRTLRVADVDGDGRPDVVVNDSFTGALRWYRRTSDAEWSRFDIEGAVSKHGHFGTTLDFDGDGRVDILMPVYQGVTLVRNADGGATWDIVPLAKFELEERQLVVSEVAAGDLDLDGRRDVAFVVSSLTPSPTEPRRGGLYWMRLVGTKWEASRVFAEDNATVGVALVDFDGDGDLDVVTNSEYPANTLTLWNNRLR
jgi:hypothetical protein